MAQFAEKKDVVVSIEEETSAEENEEVAATSEENCGEGKFFILSYFFCKFVFLF